MKISNQQQWNKPTNVFDLIKLKTESLCLTVKNEETSGTVTFHIVLRLQSVTRVQTPPPFYTSRECIRFRVQKNSQSSANVTLASHEGCCVIMRGWRCNSRYCGVGGVWNKWGDIEYTNVLWELRECTPTWWRPLNRMTWAVYNKFYIHNMFLL